MNSQDLQALLVMEKLITKGAEAEIYLGSYMNIKAIIKRRIPKKYRHPTLDEQLLQQRNKKEIKVISKGLFKGLPFPRLLGTNMKKHTIILEFIDGPRLNVLLSQSTPTEEYPLTDIFQQIGEIIAQMHLSSIVHGDLTAYNIIIHKGEKKPYIIDFGLADFSTDIEKFASDIVTFYNTLKVFPQQKISKLFHFFWNGYEAQFPEPKKVLNKYKQILRRGRYFLASER